MLGADRRVNWCSVHQHDAHIDCDDCLTEASAWQSDRKLRMETQIRDGHDAGLLYLRCLEEVTR